MQHDARLQQNLRGQHQVIVSRCHAVVACTCSTGAGSRMKFVRYLVCTCAGYCKQQIDFNQTVLVKLYTSAELFCIAMLRELKLIAEALRQNAFISNIDCMHCHSSADWTQLNHAQLPKRLPFTASNVCNPSVNKAEQRASE